MPCSGIEAREGAAEFAGWPDTWVAAYEHFDRFIAGQTTTWPAARLEIAEDGTITHGVRLHGSINEHVYFYLFHYGRGILEVGMAENLGNRYPFQIGEYTACVRISSKYGYQYVYPAVRFAMDALPAGSAPPGSDDFPLRVRTLAAPADSESVWPNERMLHFLDFDIFPHGSPSHLHTGSRKVTPVVHLKLDNHGIVERDLLPNAGAEQLLRWRIYHNGRLVRRDSAAGITHIDTNLGSGTYQVWMGVEGPNGFMPVSNLLEYPLFPDASGNKVVVPVDTDGDGMPDFFAALSATEELRSAQKDAESGAPVSEATSAFLRELWGSWRIQLSFDSPVTMLDSVKPKTAAP